MKLKDFIQKGYSINAQVPMVETREVDLHELMRGQSVENCESDVIDSWNSDDKTRYDVIDSDGQVVSGYKPTLFTDEDVREFIANLPE